MRIKKRKKGQAAVEFLTTYGWAIMGVILTIGALSYFDFLNSQKYTSENCNTGAQLQCLEAYAENGGIFRIHLRNNYPVDIKIDDVKILAGGTEYSLSVKETILRGESKIIAGDPLPSAVLSPGSKETLSMRIEFSRDGGTQVYNLSGTATVKVQTVSLCGNGVVDSGEDCDSPDIPLSCTDFGYAGGTLGCTPSCTYDPSGCHGGGLPTGDPCNTGAACASGLCVGTRLIGPTVQGTCEESCDSFIYPDGSFSDGYICSSGGGTINNGGICVLDEESGSSLCERYNIAYDGNYFFTCNSGSDDVRCDDDAVGGFNFEGATCRNAVCIPP